MHGYKLALCINYTKGYNEINGIVQYTKLTHALLIGFMIVFKNTYSGRSIIHLVNVRIKSCS